MSQVTALHLSTWVKSKLFELGEITIQTHVKHSTYIKEALMDILLKCNIVFGEQLGTAIFEAWQTEMFNSDMSSRYADDGRALNYHNMAHVVTMLKRMFNDKSVSSEFSQINNVGYSKLMLAIMFHDIFHSHGVVDDVQNVTAAVNYFYARRQCVRGGIASALGLPIRERVAAHDFISSLLVSPTMLRLNVTQQSKLIEDHFGQLHVTDYFDDVCRAIQYTQYPYLEGGVFDKLPAYLRKIREYDMTSMLSDDWYQQIYEGLFLEMNKDTQTLTADDFIQFCTNQHNFIASLDTVITKEQRLLMMERTIFVTLLARNGHKTLKEI